MSDSDVAVAAQRAVSRNDPCPCGSGRRFKDCHGSLRGDAPASRLPPQPVRKSRYRPAGSDWAGLADDEQDRLGALMEVALAHQRAARVREAESAYRAVLEQAPHTHDALHMLGIGGAGLSPIAQVLLEMGVQVSGSDRQPNAMTARLAARGATVMPQQSAENLTQLAAAQRPDVVLISSAVSVENPERQAAEALGLLVASR